MENLECPLCESKIKSKINWPSVRSTPWSDSCACSDLGFCAYHQLPPKETPSRPSPEIMKKRALKRAEKQDIVDKEKIKEFKDRLSEYEHTKECNEKLLFALKLTVCDVYVRKDRELLTAAEEQSLKYAEEAIEFANLDK